MNTCVIGRGGSGLLRVDDGSARQYSRISVARFWRERCCLALRAHCTKAKARFHQSRLLQSLVTTTSSTTASARPTRPTSCCSMSASIRTRLRARISRCRFGSSASPTTPRSKWRIWSPPALHLARQNSAHPSRSVLQALCGVATHPAGTRRAVSTRRLRRRRTCPSRCSGWRRSARSAKHQVPQGLSKAWQSAENTDSR